MNKIMHGLRFRGSEAEVSLWAPLAEKVSICMKDTGKCIPLEKQQYGYWELRTEEIHPGDLYRFKLNGEKEFPDPASRWQPEGVHGPSGAFDTEDFEWKDQAWNNHELGEYLLYEVHTGTFTPEGTFEGIEKKLDHLKELGVNAIEIMPVAQFPGSRNWGYDGVFPFAVQHSYGGARGLQRLVNACHLKGLAVVLDVVYNHLGPEGNYLANFAPYFTAKYPTPWGDALNFDDTWCDGVRRYFAENAMMWFRDFHIDALRLDAVHAIRDFSPVHILRELKEHTLRLEETSGKKHYLIAECDLNDTRFIRPVEEDGYGMDAQWLDEFHHSLRVAAGQERIGYYADFDGISHLAKAYREAYVYNGSYSGHRRRRFGTHAGGIPGRRFVVFSQNHDQVGNRMMGERSSQLVSFGMQKLLAGAVFSAPFLPMLFMGEEYSESNPFLYFVSHSDPELIAAVREGRKAEFAAFQHQGEVSDPQSVETFRRSSLQWKLLEREPHQTMFRYYQALISLRKQEALLRRPQREGLSTFVHAEQNVLVLRRAGADRQLLCLMNFSQERQDIVLPGDRPERSAESPAQYPWKKLFDSAEPGWNGPGAAPEQVPQGDRIALQPASFLVYGRNTSL